MTSEPTPESDLALLEAAREIQEQSITMEEWDRIMRDRAATRLMYLMLDQLTRITVAITSHYDWQRLRINVAHKVEPKLVKWSRP